MNVSATSRRASVAASVVEPAQAFLLRIASAPHTSVGATSSLNRLRRARVRYKFPLKNYIIYIRNQNSSCIPKKNWRDGEAGICPAPISPPQTLAAEEGFEPLPLTPPPP